MLLIDLWLVFRWQDIGGIFFFFSFRMKELEKGIPNFVDRNYVKGKGVVLRNPNNNCINNFNQRL